MDEEQRRHLWENGYLIIKGAISAETVAFLNERFEAQLAEEKPSSALTWYLNRERGVELQADGLLAPRKLWHNDLILPPKVEPVLRELCGSFEWGHLHEDCPPDRVGRFRLDHDNAHWIGPYDPRHEADPAIDFPEEVPPRVAGKPYPGMAVHTPDGIIQDGFHGGPPLFHISCMCKWSCSLCATLPKPLTKPAAQTSSSPSLRARAAS